MICIAHGARVMPLGTVEAICYEGDQRPPDLPIAVTVKFDSYCGPTLPDGTVPITPLRRTWFSTTKQCSRLQIPLKLAWAVTIHKSQGLTLDKAVIDIGKKEFSTELTFVACSRVRQLTDLLFVPPFSFQRVANLSKSVRLKDRLQEDSRLQQMSTAAPNVSSSSSELPCTPPLCPPSLPPLPPSPHPLPSPVQSHNIEMLDGSHPPSTPSQLLLLPSPHPIPSPVLSTESLDIEILDSSQSYICPYKYHPVNEEWQRVTCENMALMYCGSNRTVPGSLHIPLTVPGSVRSIKGDGKLLLQVYLIRHHRM